MARSLRRRCKAAYEAALREEDPLSILMGITNVTFNFVIGSSFNLAYAGAGFCRGGGCAGLKSSNLIYDYDSKKSSASKAWAAEAEDASLNIL